MDTAPIQPVPSTPLLQRIRLRAREHNIPLHVLIELTNRCNLRCRHCYVDHDDRRGELTLPELRTVLDQVARQGTLFVTFTGGEALFRPDFFDIAEHARRNDCSVCLFTNGTLITAEVADRLKALALERAEISILAARAATHDAITGVSGSFDAAVRAVRLLRERGVAVQIKTAWMRLNIEESEDLFDLAKELGVSFRGGNLIIHHRTGAAAPEALAASEDQLMAMRRRRLARYPTAILPPDPPPLTDEAKRDTVPCGAGQTSVRIDARGNVYPCAAINVVLGNLRTTPFGSIWRDSEELQRIRAIRLSDLPVCRDCTLWHRCTRCAGLALTESGSLCGASPQACLNARAMQGIVEEKRCELQ